jgi:two-component system CheB/CheR fusion protein
VIEERDRRSMPPVHEGAEAPGAPTLVVALGASAGSLEALREFFVALDEGAGIGFVVVEHLDPSGKSLLPSVLNQFAKLPVSEIGEGLEVRGNHIFVAPPNAIVELDKTSFRLAPIDGAEERRTPIDAFFRSIAGSFGPRAVGLVLSGAGSDGSVGVQEIANSGGMTMAQDPEQAKYDSMPRNAIATGVIDHVLTAKEMAEELLAYVGHIEQLSADAGEPPNQEEITQVLAQICDLLEKATNHNFKHYKTSTLVRRIQRRMQVLKLNDVATYVGQLGDAEEITQLFRELLIGVTSFFRDPDAFQVLAREVIQPLIEHRRGEPLRFWVPGCATGEEAYSLAAIVRETLDHVAEPPNIQIFATDIDERALSIARQGIYPAGAAEQISKERLERFFIKKGKRYQVIKELREICLFSPHNLINDPPFSRIDLISCRNLLIYFGPHLQKKLIPLFHYALRPGGYLFLGPSENLSSHKELFAPVSAKHRISQRKATAINASSAVLPGVGAYRGNVRSAETLTDPPSDLHQFMQRILLDEFAPKSLVVTAEGQILSASGNMERYLTVTEGTFQNNVVRLARPGLRVGIRAALNDSIKIRRKVIHDKVSVQVDAGIQRVRLTVQPMPRVGEESDLFLIVFQDLGTLLPREDGGAPSAVSAEADSIIEQLERELSSTREDLEKTIRDLEGVNEELKSSNEELVSMNEELQSANEELETSKEEVQSSNEALARAHSNLSNLLTSTAIATIFLDDDLNIQSFTPAVAALYNVLPSDVGRPLGHITPRCAQMPPLPSPTLLRASQGAQEDDLVTEEGRWYLRRALPYQTHDGKAEGMVVTFIDVTDLKLAEATVRRHQHQLQLITDSLPVLISYVDSEQYFRFTNQAYERWLNVPYESLNGKQVRDVLGDAAYEVVRPFIEQALAGEMVRYEADVPYPNGTRAVRAEYVPDRGPEGEVRGYHSLVLDISDERQVAKALAEAKQTAEHASRAKSDFLANMSHEIRTPMMAILGYTELLQVHVSEPDNLACIDAIRRSSHHLMEIINDILDLSKVESGMMRTELVRFAPGGVLRDVVDGLRIRAAEKGLTLDLTHSSALPATIESDPTRFRQVLLNLVGNAIKFTEKGGVLVVARVLASQRLLEVQVIDSGIGMSTDQTEHLFEPFMQGDRSVTRRHGGAGLGLVISKHLLKLLGGDIRVASTPGQGSRFSFTVATGSLDNIEMAGEAVDPPFKQIVPATRLDGTRVLVVDDRPDMRYLIQSCVEDAGATVVAARDGEMALQRVAQAMAAGDAFHAVILDMQMPVMDGFEAAPRIRKAGHRGLILALTANAMKGTKERCLAAGCDEYLAKPVDRLQLLNVLAHVRAEPSSAPGANLERDERDVSGSPRLDQQPTRVLLVDDNADATESLAAILDTYGFDVSIAQTGAKAIEYAAATHPQVVILDLGLPDMDGYAVLEHLKQMETLSAARFIALSGRGMPEDLQRMREAGFHHQFVKPVKMEMLIKSMKP